MPDPVSPALIHKSRGRRVSAVVSLLVIYGGLAAAAIGLHASPWILAPLVLATLPALWEVLTDPRTRLTLDDHDLRWQAGRRDGHVAVDRIASARFDTLWDFSVRVTLTLDDGRSLRLPPDLHPPHRALEEALMARNVSTERHHFAPGYRARSTPRNR
ncbi:MAG: hypothetical protein CML68_21740 [Rhodobacteraceae bacterium]|nr:hypothetical protein [Paracoccaceae bacterium]